MPVNAWRHSIQPIKDLALMVMTVFVQWDCCWLFVGINQQDTSSATRSECAPVELLHVRLESVGFLENFVLLLLQPLFCPFLLLHLLLMKITVRLRLRGLCLLRAACPLAF